ncbi:MAG: sulfite exporter TauE/SafE family protein [Oscillospiraceae bacterium]|nr:sulfite exporter TauE/SafE family protein [Oscillospiraceae bacterium]
MTIINIIAGFLTGVAASMGLGGGFILIIFLTVFAGTAQEQAGGINLLFFLPIALISIIIHSKNKLIDWRVIPAICIAGAFGVAGGAALLYVIDESWLRKLFAGLLVFVGLREMFHRKKATNN